MTKNRRCGALLALLFASSFFALRAEAQSATAPLPENLKVSDARVSRRQVRPGEILYVTLSVRNFGPTIAHSQTPAPKTVYRQSDTMHSLGYAAQSNRYSVVMTLSGPQGNDWPFRWGIGGDLAIGRSRRVRYPLRLTSPGIYTIYVGTAVGDNIARQSAPYLTGIEVVAYGARPQTSTQSNVIDPTPPSKITVNGEPVATDQRPIFANMTVLVPIRFVMEAMQANVQWKPRNRQVMVRRGDFDATLNIGSRYHTVGGKSVSLYTRPQIRNGRTMVPLRFLTEAMGGTVQWDARTKTVNITLPAL